MNYRKKKGCHLVKPGEKDGTYGVEVLVYVDLDCPMYAVADSTLLSYTTKSYERTHVGSVETLVHVIVIVPLDWAELGPVIVSGSTPGA